VPIQILDDVSVSHPRRDDRRHAIMVEYTVELEDERGRHVFPDDHLFAKALFLTKSAHVQIQSSPLTPRTHLLKFHQTLLIRGPQDFYCHRFAVLGPVVDLCARSRCVGFIGENYRAWVDPVRVGEVLTSARESRERGEYPRTCLEI